MHLHRLGQACDFWFVCTSCHVHDAYMELPIYNKMSRDALWAEHMGVGQLCRSLCYGFETIANFSRRVTLCKVFSRSAGMYMRLEYAVSTPGQNCVSGNELPQQMRL